MSEQNEMQGLSITKQQSMGYTLMLLNWLGYTQEQMIEIIEFMAGDLLDDKTPQEADDFFRSVVYGEALKKRKYKMEVQKIELPNGEFMEDIVPVEVEAEED
ncbi:hypothetical protein IC620_05650 [Hazenella sp. IB182357]|uniref:Uncharacterized protein n=1 Tax=Polycladospora coralii TaxID=2771432 RepID=A0A926N8N9_9BACL|nr:hypothetical protein [Polycladospora coralii]MBD1371842.1 hypothetical protein [Polycladospora coralii]MBS7529303.1 hypothetical protein [Polycladospora coralii]